LSLFSSRRESCQQPKVAQTKDGTRKATKSSLLKGVGIDDDTKAAALLLPSASTRVFGIVVVESECDDDIIIMDFDREEEDEL
jgi:hypothetical protein|tara:strand:+ start:242 stop:490 length:249 start_codon:yes stop_codon:yes gene_type:complete